MNEITQNNEKKIEEFFIYFKNKCPKTPLLSKHRIDDKRKCKKCYLVSNSEWKLTKDGINYYKIHVSMYEKTKIKKELSNILNKMSNENFDRQSIILINIFKEEVKTPLQIQESTKQLFTKILSDKQYIPLYVLLCSNLTKIIIKVDSNTYMQNNIKKCMQNNIKKTRNKYNTFSFINEIINLSQKEYVLYIDILKNKLLKNNNINKNHMNNNIEFIGHLYCFNILHSNIIHNNIRNLLDFSKNITNSSDDLIEIICKFLTICGEKLYISYDIKKIDNYFDEITKIIPIQSKRTQFIFMDLIDLYKKWKRKL